MGNLYVVFAVDTEGPVFDPRYPDLLATWDAIDEFLAKIFSTDFRARVPDSDGGGLIISWFIMSWTGFTTNPVRRDFGYHKIYDHYMERRGAIIREYRDGVYWHYHHPPPSGVGNEWGTDWLANQEYHNILNRLIIDRGYFPAVFRAGGTIETNETSAWLEQWIPFDYSNRSSAWGRCAREADLYDWSRAPADWSTYHPSIEDYQKPGDMRRVILRCLDLLTHTHRLEEEDIAAAFERAAGGKDTVLATFDHDYRDRADIFVERLLNPLARVARRYPTVHWRYANALEAAQSVLGYPRLQGPAFAIHYDPGEKAFVVAAERPLFGPCPYVVCKYPDSGEYIHEDVRPVAERVWLLPAGEAKRARLIGVASSDAFGNVGVTLCAWDGKQIEILAAPGESNGKRDNR